MLYMIAMVKIRQISRNEIFKVSTIHQQAFESFFLTQLGSSFLDLYYTALQNNSYGILLGLFDDNNNLLAFAASTQKAVGFHLQIIKENIAQFGVIGLKLFFTRPAALIRLLKNITKKSTPNDNGEYAELLSIGVATNQQRNGYGQQLILKTEEILRQKGCTRISLTTDSVDNLKAIAFYKNLGYRVLSKFITYPNREMLRLIKPL